MAFLELLIFIAIGVVIAAYPRRAKENRRLSFAVFAANNDLTYSQVDESGLLSHPFSLFRRGDGRGIENVVSGEWGETPLALFDYWYYTEKTNKKGKRTLTYFFYNCAVVPVPISSPNLTIEPKYPMTRFADQLSYAGIRYESYEFNRAWAVRCQDPKFASDLIDPRMMHWLLEQTASPWTFELVEGAIICALRRVPPARLGEFLRVASGFVSRVPNVVNVLYPAKV